MAQARVCNVVYRTIICYRSYYVFLKFYMPFEKKKCKTNLYNL